MAEPTIAPAAPPALTPDSTKTGGLSDPSFVKGLEAAFASRAAGETAPAPNATAPKVQADNQREVSGRDEQASEPAPVDAESSEAEPKTSTSKAGWKELKRLKAEAEEARTKAETRLKELEGRLSKYNDDEITRTKKERDDYEQRLKAFAIEHDPQFEQEYKSGVDRIKREAEQVLGDRSSRFKSLLDLPDGEFKRQQLAQLIEDLDDFTKQDVYGLMRDHRKLSTDKQLKIENARNNWEKLQAIERQRQQEGFQKFMQKFDDTLRQWQDPKDGIPALQLKDGDDAHNNAVREAVQRARDVFSGKLTEEETIKAALWAASAPNILNNLNTLAQENARLKQEIAELKVAEPDLGGTSGSERTTEDPSLSKMSYPERIAAMIERAGGFQNR